MEGSPRFNQCLSKVSAWLRKFRDLSGLLARSVFGVAKGSVEGSPITSLNLSPSSSSLFSIFLNSVHFGAFSHSKGPGQNDTFVFLGSLQQMAPQGFGQMAVASENVEGSANCSLHLSPKWLLLGKNSLEGSANCPTVLHLSPSPPPGVKVA